MTSVLTTAALLLPAAVLGPRLGPGDPLPARGDGADRPHLADGRRPDRRARSCTASCGPMAASRRNRPTTSTATPFRPGACRHGPPIQPADPGRPRPGSCGDGLPAVGLRRWGRRGRRGGRALPDEAGGAQGLPGTPQCHVQQDRAFSGPTWGRPGHRGGWAQRASRCGSALQRGRLDVRLYRDRPPDLHVHADQAAEGRRRHASTSREDPKPGTPVVTSGVPQVHGADIQLEFGEIA